MKAENRMMAFDVESLKKENDYLKKELKSVKRNYEKLKNDTQLRGGLSFYFIIWYKNSVEKINICKKY